MGFHFPSFETPTPELFEKLEKSARTQKESALAKMADIKYMFRIEEYTCEFLEYSAVEYFIQQILNGWSRVQENPELEARTFEDILRYHVTKHDYPQDPFSRSTSTLHNLVEDLKRYVRELAYNDLQYQLGLHEK